MLEINLSSQSISKKLNQPFYYPNDDGCQKHQNGNLIDAMHHS